jgi:hypothetical protein
MSSIEKFQFGVIKFDKLPYSSLVNNVSLPALLIFVAILFA